MDVFKIALLILAYSVGIATLIIQILCYLKGIEFKETIFFIIAFLATILIVTILEFSLINESRATSFLDVIFQFCLICISVTTPINIHSERKVKKIKIKNRTIIFLGFITTILLLSGKILNLGFTKPIIFVFLGLSLIYSMLIILTTKPGLMIKHRDKTEKLTAKIFLVFIPIYIIFQLVTRNILDAENNLFDGSVIIALIFLYLAVYKLLDDIERLRLFNTNNKFEAGRLAKFNITNRESEVVNLLIKGRSYKDISEELFISMPTVKTHISNIYSKMSINNKVELINLLND